jgi:hypothetical protein
MGYGLFDCCGRNDNLVQADSVDCRVSLMTEAMTTLSVTEILNEARCICLRQTA